MTPFRVSFFIIAASLGLSGNANNPPTGHTGGFSEPTCAPCHGGALNPSGRVAINPPPGYTPGATVPIQVTIQDSGGVKWGFQLSARFSNGSQAGGLESRESQTAVRTAPWGGNTIQYALQSSAPLQGGANFVFTVYWTAPPDNSKGEVVFNAVGVASNNDGKPELDRVYAVEVRSSGAPPKISAGGVVSAASFLAAPNNQLAPGQLISIFGTGMAPGGALVAASIPLPTQLGPTRVRLGSLDLPLLYVSPLQINAQLAFEAAESGTNQVTVLVNGLVSAAETVTLMPAAPALFTVRGGGTGATTALHADFTPVDSMRPAVPGEITLLFGTGLGATSPGGQTGAAGKGERLVAPLTVTMGGQDARVLFAGMAPGFVGLYQVNAVVPQVSGAVDVVVKVGGFSSRPGVTLLVQP